MLQECRHVFTAMGSPCEARFFAHDREAASAAANAVHDEVERLETRYSRYREDSTLSAINRAAASGEIIEIDAETSGLFDYADTCHRQSAGLFDITSGILRRVWHKGRTDLPSDDEIDAVRASIGWHRVRRDGSCLRCEPGTEIDFGGIVKEYAADRAAALLQQLGLQHGIVNLGGDIRVLGPQPDGSPWRIGIRDPHRADRSLGTLNLVRGAVATSGDYERGIVLNGRRYGHVLNPRTGWPVRHLVSVTVIADVCLVAGSASTIAMLMESAGPAWLQALGLPHYWIDANGRTGGSFTPDGANH